MRKVDNNAQIRILFTARLQAFNAPEGQLLCEVQNHNDSGSSNNNLYPFTENIECRVEPELKFVTLKTRG